LILYCRNGYRLLESRRSTGIPGVDVTANYRGELKLIRGSRGRRYRFTFGDYIVKV
jgi:hypothetical protein